MKIKTKSIRFVTLALVLLVSIVSISAFGVGCVYSNENPLKLSPGESSEVLINLQNDNAIQLKAIILKGADIAEFLDASDVYSVPANGGINARLKISIPANANIGEEKMVTLNFQQISGAQAGTVGFNTAIEKSFKVFVVEKPAPVAEETPAAEGISAIWWVLCIIVIIALIAIIWFVIKSRKE